MDRIAGTEMETCTDTAFLRPSDTHPLGRDVSAFALDRGAVATAAPQNKRRVLVIARHFPPCRLVGAQACAQVARYLPHYGWETVVLTVKEQFVEERDPSDRRT